MISQDIVTHLTLRVWACAPIPLAPTEIAAVLKKAPKLHYFTLRCSGQQHRNFNDFPDPKNALILPHGLKLLFSCTVVNVPSAADIRTREIAQLSSITQGHRPML